jgi:PAS domain S-box-containing protein
LIDAGFSNIVHNALGLAISLKKEIQNQVQFNEYRELEKKLRQSNQFLQLVLDHVPAGIFWKDTNSRYLGCNRLHARAMNFQNTKDIVGKMDSAFHYSEEKLELFHKDDRRVIRDNQKISRITTYESSNPNKREIWTETNKVPLQGDDGSIIGIVGFYKDITYRINLEKQSMEREAHYRAIIDNLSEGVIVYDSELNIINCNPSAEKITGYKLYELMDGLHRKSGKLLRNEKGEVLEKEELPHFLTQNTGKPCLNSIIGFETNDKQMQWIRFNTVPIFKNETELSIIITTLVDITAEKNSNDKIQAIQENQTSIFSNTHICFVYLDTNFNFIQVNDAYAKACGYSNEFFVGKNHFDLYPNEENEAIFKKVVETGETYTVYAKPFSFPDHPEWGITYWDWTLKLIKDAKGNNKRLLFSLVDVTENIKSQQKLQETELLNTQIFSLMSEAIIVLDQKRTIVTCNPSAENFLNLIEIYKSSHIDFHFVSETGSRLTEEEYPSNLTLKTGKEYKGIVIGLIANQREDIWISVSTKPIFDSAKNEVLYVVMAYRDITERKKIQQELFIKKKMEAIGNIASGIVHDFNNILQPVMLFSHILHTELSKLQRTEQIDKLINYASKIHIATNRGKDMVSQILKVSQKINEPTQTVDIAHIIKETLNEIEILKPNNIRVEFLTELKSAKVEASPTNIHQVISNLCNNSIYAMKHKPNSTLFLSLTKNSINDELRSKLNHIDKPFVYEIIIKDEGIGIKQEHLDRIFEPYFSTKQNDGGTGLGLASVYSIVQSLDGSISVVSKENIGTMFTIYLPAK